MILHFIYLKTREGNGLKLKDVERLRECLVVERVFSCSGMGRSGSEETVTEEKERCEFLLRFCY